MRKLQAFNNDVIVYDINKKVEAVGDIRYRMEEHKIRYNVEYN